MKVAVCLAGHMRTYEKTYDAWYKNILEPYSPDVFIHTWMNGGQWKVQHDTHHADHGTVLIDDSEINLTDIKNKFNPVGFVAESYSTRKEVIEQMAKPVYEWRDSLEELYHEYRVNSYISAFYKVWSCNVLKLERESIFGTYDMVIMSRPDVTPGVLPEYILNDLGHVYIKPCNGELMKGWMWNIMFVTNSHYADVVSDMYTLYPNKFREAREKNIPHKFFEPHNILYRHLVELNNISVVDTIPCEIVR
jgi:hypothetical protein